MKSRHRVRHSAATGRGTWDRRCVRRFCGSLGRDAKTLADGETSVADVADELITFTSARASYCREVIAPRFDEVLTPELLHRLALQIAPYGDDYHVHA